MLNTTQALRDLFDEWRANATLEPYWAELFNITLPGGRLIQWTNADEDIAWNGHTWTRGPGIERGSISKSVGTNAAQFDIDFSYDDSVLIDGVKFATFLANNGLLQAKVQFYRAYARDRSSPIIGTVPKFGGFVSQLAGIGETRGTVTVSDVRSLLNVQVPIATWGPPCDHIVFDAGCGLNRDDFKVSGAVNATSSTRDIFTDLDIAAGYLTLGKITFTSGANAGETRTVKTQPSSRLVVIRAFPVAPAIGDTFVAYPGCDLTEATCTNKFNNTHRFKGQPFVPVAETAA